MAKSVFYSFHYDLDVARVQQVRNIGAVEGQPLLNAQEWEEVQKKGDAAIEKWIDDQMKYKKAVVVLVGSQTAGRKWVRYEIRKAWGDRRPLVGVRIHGLKDLDGKTATAGADPFAQFKFDSGRSIADYVTLHDPVGTSSQDVYASIAANLASWVDNAYARP